MQNQPTASPESPTATGTRALEELDSGNENRQHLDMFITLMRLSYMRNIHDLKKWSEVVATFGREKQKRMLDYFTTRCARVSR